MQALEVGRAGNFGVSSSVQEDTTSPPVHSIGGLAKEQQALIAFLSTQDTSLKCSPQEFYAWLQSEDIGNMTDLESAVDDDEYLLGTLVNGGYLKKFKRVAFKTAVKTAVAMTQHDNDLASRVEELEYLNQNLSQQLDEIQSSRARDLTELRETLTEEKLALQNDNTNLRNQIRLLQQGSNELSSQFHMAKQSGDQSRQQLRALSEWNASLKNELQQSRSLVQGLSNQLRASEESTGRLKQERDALDQRVHECQRENRALIERLNIGVGQQQKEQLQQQQLLRVGPLDEKKVESLKEARVRQHEDPVRSPHSSANRSTPPCGNFEKNTSPGARSIPKQVEKEKKEHVVSKRTANNEAGVHNASSQPPNPTAIETTSKEVSESQKKKGGSYTLAARSEESLPAAGSNTSTAKESTEVGTIAGSRVVGNEVEGMVSDSCGSNVVTTGKQIIAKTTSKEAVVKTEESICKPRQSSIQPKCADNHSLPKKDRENVPLPVDLTDFLFSKQKLKPQANSVDFATLQRLARNTSRKRLDRFLATELAGIGMELSRSLIKELDGQPAEMPEGFRGPFGGFSESSPPQTLTRGQLSLLANRLKQVESTISPIFKLIRGDEESVIIGRKLLVHEHEMKILKADLIVEEHNRKTQMRFLENKLDDVTEKEAWLLDQIRRLEDEIQDIPSSASSSARPGLKNIFGFGWKNESETAEEEEAGSYDEKIQKKGDTKNQARVVPSKKKRKKPIGDTANIKDPEERRRKVRLKISANKNKEDFNKRLRNQGMDEFDGQSEKKLDEVTDDEVAFVIDLNEKEIETKMKLLEDVQAKIAELRNEMEGDGPDVEAKQNEVQLKRAKIIELKGQKEDKSFDINTSRDEHGHTFLMVAVLSNDLGTAELCLDLGAKSDEIFGHGLTPTLVANYFHRDEMAALLADNRAKYPTDRMDMWEAISRRRVKKNEVEYNWETTLQIAENAAIPSKTLFGQAVAFEADETKRMQILTAAERNARVLACFDGSLSDPNNNSSIRRVVYLEDKVYNWFKKDRNTEFLAFLKYLVQDAILKKPSTSKFVCHRRAVIGIKEQYEVLGVHLRGSQLLLFTPFVTNEIDGVYRVGALVWAVVDDKEASLYKTLIENMEFSRTKVDTDDRFPSHADNVMRLGKDMHLLDLETTSIYTCRPMLLYNINVDEGELELLSSDPNFTPKKRVLDYEEKLAKALFRDGENEEEEVLSGTREDMSTQLSGGAGTGKTFLLTKKVVREDVEQRVLVVTRLPRLLSTIKNAVEQERNTNYVTLSTYDDLLGELARKVEAPEGEKRHFAIFSQVQFGDISGTGEASSVSFLKGFIREYLSEKDRKRIRQNNLKPLTLYTAFRTVKSNSRCLEKHEPLTLEEYLKLPEVFGLDECQRKVVYDVFQNYKQWLASGDAKWDEADRVLYVLKWGHPIFSESEFCSWETRYLHGRGEGVVDCNGTPLAPFFYHCVYVDEAQDFTELDLTLFVRMSKSVRNLFVAADPAQSVELGICMHKSTVNDVISTSLAKTGGTKVKNVLQALHVRSNRRTHEQNLALSETVRKILKRSFQMPGAEEHALMKGQLPQALMLRNIGEIADRTKFNAPNIVFIVPDEHASNVRLAFRDKGIQNDVFGVREAKGLEYDSAALLGFFQYFEKSSKEEWKNSLRWLFSEKGMTTTESSEVVLGMRLQCCDYLLSHPELQDEASMLYTALTRARNRLYLIEYENDRRGLAGFAFRCFIELGLVEERTRIDEKQKEMTPQQHKARGVQYVTQAIGFDRASRDISLVQEKFEEAIEHFMPHKGNDKVLLDQCTKHMKIVLMKRTLLDHMKNKFFNKQKGTYDVDGRFSDLLQLEEELFKFFSLGIGDTFVIEEMHEVLKVVEELFVASPYSQIRFGKVCDEISRHLY